VLSFGVLVGATRVILVFPSNYSCRHRLSVAAGQRWPGTPIALRQGAVIARADEVIE
jgi:hypothetical protein